MMALAKMKIAAAMILVGGFTPGDRRDRSCRLRNLRAPQERAAQHETAIATGGRGLGPAASPLRSWTEVFAARSRVCQKAYESGSSACSRPGRLIWRPFTSGRNA